LSNAPSIPTKNNCYGYEESSNGQLTINENPEQTFTGRKEDSVGPGQYEVGGLFKRKDGSNWHSSCAMRFLPISQAIAKVGPGSYNVDSGIKGYGKTFGSSPFLSTVPKLPTNTSRYVAEDSSGESEDETEPGPGHYNPDITFHTQRAPTKKSIPSKPYEPRQSTLGPGYYDNTYVRSSLTNRR
jgi:hypothetical protein